MMNILMVEDDETIAELLSRYLSQYAKVKHVVYPLEALQLLDDKSFDIIILDLSLPQLDGLELCKMIRKVSDAGIIISSARSDINDKLYALENGADDYLPKPYDPRELYARIKLLYKRNFKGVNPSSAFHNNKGSCQISYKNKVLDLTLAEYEIMQLFLDNVNQAIPREDIANSISSHRFESGLESINVLIGRLRKKIECDEAETSFISTVRGIGYRFNE